MIPRADAVVGRGHVVAAALMTAAAVAAAALVTWGADRGFGMVDEGYYLVATSHGYGGVTWFGAIVHRLLPWACDDVVALRHVRLAVLLTASIAFGVAAHRWTTATELCPPGRWSRMRLIASAFVGSAVAYAWLPQTLSYNDLNEAGSLAAGAALLVAVARCAVAPEAGATSWLVATCACVQSLQFFVKPPSAALGAAMALAALLWMRPRAWRRVLASYAAGAAVGFACFFLLVAGPREWWTELTSSLSAVAGTSHGTSRIVGRYVWDVRVYAVRAATSYGVPVALAAALTFWAGRRGGVLARSTRACLAAAVAAALLIAGLRQEFSEGFHGIRFDSLMPYVGLLAVLAACVVGSAWGSRGGQPTDDVGRRRARIVGAAWLALAPAAAAFGTNNHIVQSMTGHLAAWFVLAAVVASWLDRRATASPGVVGTAALCVAAAAAHLWGGYMTQPRGLAAARLDQTFEAPSVPRLRGLRLDRATRDLHEGLWSALHDAGGFHPGDPIIGLFDHPALVFTVDGRYPGVLWPVGGSVDNRRVNLDLAPREAVERSFLLVDSTTAGEAARLLQAAKLPFPEGYRALGTFANPFTGGTLTAYAPPRAAR